MPITQERFMRIVNTADDVVDGYLIIRRLTKTNGTAIANANAFLTRSDDEEAKSIVSHLLQIFTTMTNYVDEMDLITPELIANIAVEKKHFQKHAKQNDRTRSYQEQARRSMGIMPRNNSELEARRMVVPRPKIDDYLSQDMAVVEVADDDPDYQKFLKAKETNPLSLAEKYEIEFAQRKREREEAKARGENVL